jgi:hypothetical protein
MSSIYYYAQIAEVDKIHEELIILLKNYNNGETQFDLLYEKWYIYEQLMLNFEFAYHSNYKKKVSKREKYGIEHEKYQEVDWENDPDANEKYEENDKNREEIESWNDDKVTYISNKSDCELRHRNLTNPFDIEENLWEIIHREFYRDTKIKISTIKNPV